MDRYYGVQSGVFPGAGQPGDSGASGARRDQGAAANDGLRAWAVNMRVARIRLAGELRRTMVEVEGMHKCYRLMGILMVVAAVVLADGAPALAAVHRSHGHRSHHHSRRAAGPVVMYHAA